MASKWQCQHVDAKGVRCPLDALYRLHFAADHPFDHTDVCALHKEHFKFFYWYQRLDEEQDESI